MANLPTGIEIGFVTEDVSAAFARAVEAGADTVVDVQKSNRITVF